MFPNFATVFDSVSSRKAVYKFLYFYQSSLATTAASFFSNKNVYFLHILLYKSYLSTYNKREIYTYNK